MHVGRPAAGVCGGEQEWVALIGGEHGIACSLGRGRGGGRRVQVKTESPTPPPPPHTPLIPCVLLPTAANA